MGVGAEAGDCGDNGQSDAETEAAARREQRRGGIAAILCAYLSVHVYM